MNLLQELEKMMETIKQAAKDGKITLLEGWKIAQQLIILLAELSRVLSKLPFTVRIVPDVVGDYGQENELVKQFIALVYTIRTALADSHITLTEAMMIFLKTVALLKELAEIIETVSSQIIYNPLHKPSQ